MAIPTGSLWPVIPGLVIADHAQPLGIDPGQGQRRFVAEEEGVFRAAVGVHQECPDALRRPMLLGREVSQRAAGEQLGRRIADRAIVSRRVAAAEPLRQRTAALAGQVQQGRG